MRKLLIGILFLALAGSAWAQSNPPNGPPAGAQVTFPVDNFPVNGPNGSGGLQSCTAACLNTTILGPIDTTGYSGISVQYTSMGVGVTVGFQGSNDPVCSTATNWVTVSGQATAASIAVSATTSVSTNFASLTYYVPKNVHCYRSQITAYTSGTVSAEGFLVGVSTTQFYGQSSINVNPYPQSSNGSASLPITATATGTTAALTITLPGVAVKTTYICGYTISADATAATEGAATITGTISGTMNFRQSVAALANGTATAQQTFTPCIPASGANTPIVVNSVAAGAGGNAAGYAWGFQL